MAKKYSKGMIIRIKQRMMGEKGGESFHRIDKETREVVRRVVKRFEKKKGK